MLERRQSIAFLSASVLAEKFDRMSDLAVSFATRVRFSQLVAAGEWDQAVAILAKVPADFPAVERVILTDAQGKIETGIPAAPAERGEDASSQDWFRGVSKEWRPYISNIHEAGPSQPYGVVSVATPVRNDAKIVTGILVLQMRADTFFAWTRQVELGPGGYAYFVDPKGNAAGHPAAKDRILNLVDEPDARQALHGGRGTEILSDKISGEQVVTAFEPVPRFGWAAIVKQPEGAALATRRASFMYLTGIYGLLFLLDVLFAFAITRLVSALIKYRQRCEFIFERFESAPTIRPFTISTFGDGIVPKTPRKP